MNKKLTKRSTYIHNFVLSFFLPYMVTHRHDWSDLQKSTITRSSHLNAVPRTWAEDDDDLWHPKPSNVPAIGGTMATSH